MYTYIKRITDLILSFLLILILILPLIIISLSIKIESKGPVLFTQYRVGKNKKYFKMYKFRTMYQSTPENMPTSLLNNPENHITKTGAFLRRTSLDELPQLMNIFIGDMSFVGPRPVIPLEKELIKLREKYCVYHLLPGITGWAQINGRDTLSHQEKAHLDRIYVQKKGFWLDLKILLKTFFIVVKKDGYHEGKIK